ncbi:MAG: hypothetical protein AOY29_05810 [Alcanivorax borkumensis]|jgi:O-antigen/teichoic acid export membrane protein|uniref:Cell surface polysaccharide transporter n=1 Tax=Alcanivorax borkumensis (strain ATCC 700651 / DSM 11573 / NCIMB 13689 / SK2) TaxID=393595 RepID=Q0VR11_ALCBS|nr:MULTISPECIES: oligosaccharide flippase family protein [Alcanivorax]EUC71715.1 hypothetical protein Y017_02305 [Alcanivorax sp. 97CO-5]OJH06686.1 MAG: hypothetical protein AOY29_05810 [Alcanivorax borkumensis]PKG03038.1 hypothetical protein Y019_02275 [Alcanivorax sp. 97CO-6]CAL16387.1 cell surface polysaccharide transporter [Alcanivorax borkumensis SK2]
MLKSVLYKNFLSVGGMRLAGIPLTLATSVLLARLLGPEGYGYYSFAMALVPLLAIPVSSGLQQFATRQVVSYRLAEQFSLARGLVSLAGMWILLYSVLVFVFFLVASQLFPEIFEEKKWAIMLIAIFIIPFIGGNSVRCGMSKALGQPFWSELPLRLIQPALLLGIVVLLYLWGIKGANFAIYAQLISFSLAFIIAVIIFVLVAPADMREGNRTYEIGFWARSLIPFSLLSAVTLLGAQISIVLLGILGEPEAVAGMRVADRGAALVLLPLTTVNMIVAPYIARYFKQGDREKLQATLRLSSRLALLFALPAASLFLFFGEQIVGLVFGLEYIAYAFWPLVILSASQLFSVFCGSVGNVLAMSHQENRAVTGHILALSVNVILCFFLIPTYGAVGAALATGAGLIVWNLVLAYFVIKQVKVSPFPI